MSTSTVPAPGSPVDFGSRQVTAQRKLWSFTVSLRGVVVTAVLAALTCAVMIISIGSGSTDIPLSEVLGGLLGTADDGTILVVREWRLPRALLAGLFGLALGMSGAIFQSLTRNPLGSPDIIGFSAGSYSGALVVLLITGGGYFAVALGALTGGILTAFVVFVLAYRRGVQGFRLIIVGIGVSAMLSAFNTYLMLKAAPGEQLTAAVWGSGSLNGLTIETLLPVLVVLAVLLVPALALAPALRVLELGDDAAGSLGSRPTTARLAAILVGVALTALVTASAGPIAFIALVAPQIARRLTRSAGVGLIAAGMTGALLLVVSDCLAQRVFAPLQLPVGIVTVSIGGLYFIWLLVRETRRR
ncbi:ABC-type Fe3+-siderophore transport system, permease 2 component [Leucobacter sp. 7(1)]|uniref:FecCD family ABC transporter permease n=1 Tax=Leucobacter sp. 7(1) TaxID=1255613 RepID=UPI00097E9B55|nr:iron chelate uptake ABC transporter family permease subunit [Leucobacter sp. 7(1)]SJN10853.1 ABC-type Fe3+-siderophore transport system, permease 2 component [Leucobacter sp. 7(1)]